MSSFGTVGLLDIWTMLEACAPKYSKKAREHNWLITWQERSYWSLPRGDHGTRTNPDIQLGHVRNMIRQLQINEECAQQHLPQLRKKKKT
ncbi:MAG: hypothetical protein ABI629_08830 [bacterium]